MNREQDLRIDKYLWSVRIFKTRSMATDACRKGRVIINDVQVKPSRSVSPGEIIQVKKAPVLYTYRVIDIPKSRLGAKLVDGYMEDLTPDDELFKLEVKLKGYGGARQRGSGRPTKKERRDLDRIKD